MKNRFFYYFIISCLSAVFLFSCSKDDKDEKAPESFEKSYVTETIARVIRDSGLEFPQADSPADRGEAKLSDDLLALASDYMSVDVGNGEIMTAKIWLGADNHIIPTLEWRNGHPDFCSDQGLQMRTAEKQFLFTIHNIPQDDIRTVQLNYIDIETGIIEHSVMTENYGAGSDWLYEAMSEVWMEMMDLVNTNGAQGPCEGGGGGGPLTLHFSSKVKFDSPDTMIYEEFKFTISLQFNELEQAYTGISEFVWVEGYAWDKENDIYYPYPNVKSGEMEIVKLITPELAGNSIENATMNFRVPQPSDRNSSLLLLLFAQFYTSVGTQGDATAEFRIDNWQLSNDPEIVMAAYINNRDVEEDGVFTETTTFKIVQ